MRYDQIIEAITEDAQVNEVRMGQSDLDKFVDSPEAEGIVAGFEAELCFPGLGGSGEPDYDQREQDMDEDRRSVSIDNVCSFFDDGEYNNRRDVRDLRDSLTTDYLDWRSNQLEEAWSDVMEEIVREYIGENEFKFDDEVETYLTDELELDTDRVEAIMRSGERGSQFTSSKQEREAQDSDEDYALYVEARDHANTVLDDLAQEAISNNNNSYDRARELWEEQELEDDAYSEDRWLRATDLRYMSDISGNYDITWPYWTYPETSAGEFNESGAEDVARSLRRSLGVRVHASSGYHSTTRKPGLWIIEPDGSLEANDNEDMPAEIVSPPYPLKECLDKMKEFFEWAKDDMSAYSNESTGLHVGISVPYLGGNVDYLKLALLLGDVYVSDEFERVGSTYAKNAIKKIASDIDNLPQKKIKETMELMHYGLIELAAKHLKQTKGHGKYTSINMKGEYIEFRSMGNNYMDQVDQVLNTVKRFAYVTYLASRPDLERRDYSKKLYKMLKNSITDVDEDILRSFSSWAAGELTTDQLKAKLKGRAAQRDYSKSTDGQQWWWSVSRKGHAMNVEVLSDTEQGAKSAARLSVREWKYAEDDELTAKPVRKYENAPTASQPDTTASTQFDPRSRISIPGGGEFTGQWRIMLDGEEIHRFGGIGNSQSDANNFARNWVLNQIRIGQLQPVAGADLEVLPVMR